MFINMKRSTFTLACAVFALSIYTANAQSAPQTVIASTGNFATFANGSMTWTLGEVMTETYAPAGYFFTQGFNQPDTMYVTYVSNPTSPNISVYPNPVVENLIIDLSLSTGAHVLEIFDLQGQLLRKESIPANVNRLNLSFREFANGIYFMNITNTESNIRKTYKINKAE